MKTPRHLQVIAITISLFLFGCTTPGSPVRIDNIPMYGQPEIVRPAALRKADSDFIAKASAGFRGDRKAASEAWSTEGDRFLRALNYDFAMRRYNQAWLLDKESYKPYWGFARVLVQKARYPEAIRHFETAVSLCQDDYQKTALLSDMAVAHSLDEQYDRANDAFGESTNLDSRYATSWLRWSQSLFREGRYAQAWVKLKVAKSLGATAPDTFLRSLSDAMPEPK